MHSRTEVLNALKIAIAESQALDSAVGIDEDVMLSALNIDSIDILDIIFRAEKQLNPKKKVTRLTSRELTDLAITTPTVATLCNFLETLVNPVTV